MASDRRVSYSIGGAASYDLFVDLSESLLSTAEIVAHMRTLAWFCGFGVAGVRLSAALPPGADSPLEPVDQILYLRGPKSLAIALRRAANSRRALLVVLGTALVPNECVPVLSRALAVDPLFGTAQPRFSDLSYSGVFGLPGALEGGTTVFMHRAALSYLPETVISAEMLAACTLVSPRVVDSLAGDAVELFQSVRGTFLAALVAARRRGFRNVVANRAVVSVGGPEFAYLSPSEADYSKLMDWRPDHGKARRANELLAIRALEQAIASPHSPDGRLRLLVDCRGLSPMHNGTSTCILGLLDGLVSAASDWEISVLVQEASLVFHDFGRRYPRFVHVQGAPTESYAVALLPNQPWRLETIAELHRHACVVAFNMLDTIAWDIVYPADEHVEAAWLFLAQYADGVSYDSSFTEQRVNCRFPVEPGRLQRVVYLSLSSSDHCHTGVQQGPQAGHVLLFGNSYDHKDIEATLRLLADGFPDQPFVVIGGNDMERLPANVTTIPSGNCPTEKIHELIANSSCVIYPSFYEGFGLPLVESLSYGRVVFARSSPLWEEIVAHSRLPGQVVPYDYSMDLFELVGRHLAGNSLPHLASGTALRPEESPVDWNESAAGMLAFLSECLERADPALWLRRENALRSSGH